MLQGDKMKTTKKTVKKSKNLQFEARVFPWFTEHNSSNFAELINALRNIVNDTVKEFEKNFLDGYWWVSEQEEKRDESFKVVGATQLANYVDYFGGEFMDFIDENRKMEDYLDHTFDNLFTINEINYGVSSGEIYVSITFTENDMLTQYREDYRRKMNDEENRAIDKANSIEIEDEDDEEKDKNELKRLLKKYGSKMLKDLD